MFHLAAYSRRRAIVVAALLTSIVVAAVSFATRDRSLSQAEFAALYETPLPPPGRPLSVFHLGHSLVGRDMPAMLAQLAGQDYDYSVQLGWGTPLKSHWGPQDGIEGFATENAHPRFAPAREALESGRYDVFVLTEMVEIEIALEHFDSTKYLYEWVQLARSGNPDIRVYLYESWHDLTMSEGWLNRLDQDPDRYWEGVLLNRAIARDPDHRPIYVVPAGRVFASVVRAVEASDGHFGISSREAFFQRNADGSLDTIHVNDLGNYLVAVVHYATILQRSPVGLPYRLKRADGTDADGPTPALARLIQETAWRIVTSVATTGVRAN